MAQRSFTVVCDYDGGTYVSQYRGAGPADVVRQWSIMLRAEKPIPRSSTDVADHAVRGLDQGMLPTSLTGLSNVWQVCGEVGRGFYTATIILSG